MIPRTILVCFRGTEQEHETGDKPLECQDCLDYLNRCRTMLEPHKMHDGTWDKEITMAATSAATFRFFEHIHEITLQEMYIYVKMTEALAAQVHFMYDKKLIKEKVSDPDILKGVKDPEEFKRSVAKQRLEQRPKKERKHLDDREKAIKALTELGIPLASAVTSVDEKFKAQGKVVA